MGGVLVQALAVMRNDPNRTATFKGALMVKTRAVTLSNPWSTATLRTGSASWANTWLGAITSNPSPRAQTTLPNVQIDLGITAAKGELPKQLFDADRRLSEADQTTGRQHFVRWAGDNC